MRHKSSVKKPLCQDQPETPEQKEIRLLKKRLEKAKDQWRWYKDHWRQERSAHEETKVKLNASWSIVKANESTESVYKSMYNATAICSDMYKRWYEESEKNAADWKEKYEKLKSGNSKDVPAMYPSGDQEKIDEDRLEILRNIDNLVSGGSVIKKGPIPPSKDDLRLICINAGPITKERQDGSSYTGHGTGLEFLDRYTSPGVVEDKDGWPHYPINEMGGELKMAERFHVYLDQPAKKELKKKD